MGLGGFPVLFKGSSYYLCCFCVLVSFIDGQSVKFGPGAMCQLQVTSYLLLNYKKSTALQKLWHRLSFNLGSFYISFNKEVNYIVAIQALHERARLTWVYLSLFMYASCHKSHYNYLSIKSYINFRKLTRYTYISYVCMNE